MMTAKTILAGLTGLVLGLVIGFWGANQLNDPAQQSLSGGQIPRPSSSAPGSGMGSEHPGMMADVQQTLENAENNPGNVEAQLKAGDLYLRIERYDDALALYQKAADLEPDNFEANANIGKVYFDRKQFEKAADHYEKALRVNADDAGLRSDFGLTFYLREPPDTKRAAAEFRKALEIEPRHEAALQNLSVALSELKDKRELARVLERLESVNPDNAALKKLRSANF